jgi:hypothetical protein
LGRGITDAVRKVLALLPINERVARVLCALSETAGVKQGTGGTMQANANWGTGGGSAQQSASGSKIATHNTLGGQTTAESK